MCGHIYIYIYIYIQIYIYIYIYIKLFWLQDVTKDFLVLPGLPGPTLPLSFVKIEKHSLTAVLNKGYEACSKGRTPSGSELISFLVGTKVGPALAYHCTMIISLPPSPNDANGAVGISYESFRNNHAVKDLLKMDGYAVCGYLLCTHKARASLSKDQTESLEAMKEDNPQCQPLALHVSFAEDSLGTQHAHQLYVYDSGSSGSSSAASSKKLGVAELVILATCHKKPVKSGQVPDSVRYSIVDIKDLGTSQSCLTAIVKGCMKTSLVRTMSSTNVQKSPKKTFLADLKPIKSVPVPPDGLCLFHLLQACTSLDSYVRTHWEYIS